MDRGLAAASHDNLNIQKDFRLQACMFFGIMNVTNVQGQDRRVKWTYQNGIIEY